MIIDRGLKLLRTKYFQTASIYQNKHIDQDGICMRRCRGGGRGGVMGGG